MVTAQLLALLEQGYSTQVHDTNIVATMLTFGISRILTNNLNDFAPFAQHITIMPLYRPNKLKKLAFSRFQLYIYHTSNKQLL